METKSKGKTVDQDETQQFSSLNGSVSLGESLQHEGAISISGEQNGQDGSSQSEAENRSLQILTDQPSGDHTQLEEGSGRVQEAGNRKDDAGDTDSQITEVRDGNAPDFDLSHLASKPHNVSPGCEESTPNPENIGFAEKGQQMLNLESTPNPENTGFAEKGQQMLNLESFLSDFESSGSSGDDLSVMSESCMDRLIGTLGSQQTESKGKKIQEDDILEEDRCPATFSVSCVTTSAMDSLPGDSPLGGLAEESQEEDHGSGQRVSAAAVEVIENQQCLLSEIEDKNLKKSTKPDEMESEARSDRGEVYHSQLGGRCLASQQARNETLAEGRDDDHAKTMRSRDVREKERFDDSVGSVTEKEHDGKGERSPDLTSLNPDDSSSWDLSKDVQEILRLLRSTSGGSVADSMSLADFSLNNTSSFWWQDLEHGSAKGDAHMSDSFQVIEIPVESSSPEGCEDDTPVTPTVDSGPQGLNPTCTEEGFFFNIEDDVPTVPNDDELSTSTGSSCESPVPQPEIPEKCDDRQSGERDAGGSHQGQLPAEADQTPDSADLQGDYNTEQGELISAEAEQTPDSADLQGDYNTEQGEFISAEADQTPDSADLQGDYNTEQGELISAEAEQTPDSADLQGDYNTEQGELISAEADQTPDSADLQGDYNTEQGELISAEAEQTPDSADLQGDRNTEKPDSETSLTSNSSLSDFSMVELQAESAEEEKQPKPLLVSQDVLLSTNPSAGEEEHSEPHVASLVESSSSYRPMTPPKEKTLNRKTNNVLQGGHSSGQEHGQHLAQQDQRASDDGDNFDHLRAQSIPPVLAQQPSSPYAAVDLFTVKPTTSHPEGNESGTDFEQSADDDQVSARLPEKPTLPNSGALEQFKRYSIGFEHLVEQQSLPSTPYPAAERKGENICASPAFPNISPGQQKVTSRTQESWMSKTDHTAVPFPVSSGAPNSFEEILRAENSANPSIPNTTFSQQGPHQQAQEFRVAKTDHTGVQFLMKNTTDQTHNIWGQPVAGLGNLPPQLSYTSAQAAPERTPCSVEGQNSFGAPDHMRSEPPASQSLQHLQPMHQQEKSSASQRYPELGTDNLKSPAIEDSERDQKTVIVTGSSLSVEQEELCVLYFENQKRSGGGEIEEDGVKWNEDRECFCITFVDSQAAKSVSSREHTLKGQPMQAQLWSPDRLQKDGSDRPAEPASSFEEESEPPDCACFKDRVLVSGVPPGTTTDCLQNYLECVAEVAVVTITLSKKDDSALVFLEDSDAEIDVKELCQACKESPLEEGARMAFSRVPVSSTIFVTGIKSTTATDAVQFFFSNKRRNDGGPVKKVDRAPDGQSAFVHFENHEDAESVVKKGGHKLDGNNLQVRFYDSTLDGQEDNESTRPPRAANTKMPPSGQMDSFDSRHRGRQPEGKGSYDSVQDEEPSRNQSYLQRTARVEGGSHSYSSPPVKKEHTSTASAELQYSGNYKDMSEARRWPDTYSHQSVTGTGIGPGQNGRVHSTLIDSRQNSPKNKHEVESRPQPHPRQTNEQYHSGSSPQNHSSRGDSSRQEPSQLVTNPERRETKIKLGREMIETIRGDTMKLRKLVNDLKSVGGRFQWKLPDHLIVMCLSDEAPPDWEHRVGEVVTNFVFSVKHELSERVEEEERQRERSSWRDSRESDELEPPVPASSNTWSATDPQKPPSVGMQEDAIPNLKPWQVKFLKIPAALEKLYKTYPGLEVSVDEENKRAVVKAPEDVMKKALTDILSLMTFVREIKVPLTPALTKMYLKEDAEEWIKETVIDRNRLVCHWEVCDEHLILSGQSSDLPRLEQMFKAAFTEIKVNLVEEEACSLKSPAWTSFLDKLQEDRTGSPAPILFPESGHIVIVDTPSNVSKTRLALTKFLDENKQEEKTLQMNPNHLQFLRYFNNDAIKEIRDRAKEAGVSVNISKDGIVTRGPKDNLPAVLAKAKELVSSIKENKITFKKPGTARYLKGREGQDFLKQTGSAAGCFITTGGDSGAGPADPDGRILAEIKLSSSRQLQIVQGDITQCEVDAIVNAANEQLHHAGGVAAAIVKAGGQCIQEESDELVARHGDLSEGEVMVTGAGSLNCSHVIHAVGPTWRGGHRDEKSLLKQTVETTLKKADDMKLTSIAMPAISCGIFRFPIDKATGTILQAIGAFFMGDGRDSSVKTVVLIDMSEKPLHGFLDAAKMLFGKQVAMKGTPISTHPRGRHGDSHRSEDRTDRDFHRPHSDHGSGERSRLPIKIIPGEIAKSKAEVIVCTLHPSLDLRKGVLSKSILDEGGETIQQELRKFSEQHGQARLGSVVRTTGGRLRCKYVFHLSLPMWRDDRGQKMKSAVRDCLAEASRKGAKSIAFPTLGTGKLGYPGDQVASIMFSVIGQWLGEHRDSSLKEVQIIVYSRDAETLQAFKDAESHGGGRSGSRGHGHRGKGSESSASEGTDSLKVKVGRLTVMVKEGNILTEPCDAIVNSSNDNLDLSKGVLSKAISKACGRDFLEECRKQRDPMQETGVAITKVESSQLGCGSVIHVSADRFKREWKKGIVAVLCAADEDDNESVALPALGTGGRGANPESLAQAMQEAVSQFSKKARSLKEVRVVVFQKQMLQPYIAAFDPSASPRGAEGSDVDGAASPPTERRRWQEVDVYIYGNKQIAIKDAGEKIHRHMKHILSTRTETNPLIASFDPKQVEELFKLQNKHNVNITLDKKKSAVTFTGVEIDVAKAISCMKDIILSATTQRHLAAGGPPVRWQYETGKDKFADFDPENTITIEAAFKQKAPNVTFKDKRGRQYKIVFKDRKEYSVDNPESRPVTVKRRDILQEKKDEIPLPSHWEPMKGDRVKLVNLKSDSVEYKKVDQHFGSQRSVKKIERIQNPSLFQQFKVKKRELEQYNPKGTENEKRLFHGTPSDTVQSIYTNGFNRSYCGRHGTALGPGVYFAADSATSAGFAQGGQMFQARVLVGEYTPGNGTIKMAPNKPNSNRPFDSVANAPKNATVFVIFHDSQAYPEYLITFQ